MNGEKKDVTLFVCGLDGSKEPPAHSCDAKGPTVPIESSMGTVYSATCSVCSKPAFNERDIW